MKKGNLYFSLLTSLVFTFSLTTGLKLMIGKKEGIGFCIFVGVVCGFIAFNEIFRFASEIDKNKPKKNNFRNA